ncbi:sensor histidine kinase [Paenibacillus sp. M1]|uniref:Sensor histidine kinase n=1 Tax=Paenibacillus haidiansis TaxID=1574488 RepID=A0ABU7VNN2_9BACL
MKRTGIRLRLMLIMICLTTLPVVIITWIATNNTRASVEKEMIDANTSRMIWADQYLSELIAQMDRLFYTLQINEQLMQSIQSAEGPGDQDSYRTHNLIRETLTSTFFANSRKIDNLTLYGETQKLAYTVDYVGMNSARLDLHKEPWKRLLEGAIKNMYFAYSNGSIHVYHGINRFEDRKLQGAISVRLNEEIWQEIVQILQSEQESSVYLLNDSMTKLSSVNEKEPYDEIINEQFSGYHPQQAGFQFHKSDQNFYFINSVSGGQLTVIKVIPRSTVSRSAERTIRAGILTGTLFAAFSILLSVIVSLQITRPIIALARRMRKTRISDFEMTSVQTRDEIGLLESGYNSMMQRMKEMIEEEYQREIDVKNAQLMALQAQINPHFLNNTLHMIGGMALVKGVPDIYKITSVIGDLLRYAISGGTDSQMVTLDKELNHTRNYIFIQENRFAGRCQVTQYIGDELLDCILPKFTLQPLVENAFDHGLQPKEGRWKLHIRITGVRGRMMIAIKDEGIGISEGKLHEIRMRLKRGEDERYAEIKPAPGERRGGIGIKNVHDRLRLQFGEHYGLRIFSKAGEGTMVVAVLPAVHKK